MTKSKTQTGFHPVSTKNALMLTAAFFSVAAISLPAQAQQTGALVGYVTDSAGAPQSGVTVEATSPVLPRPRRTTTSSNGRYQLPLLPPGSYDITFTSPNGDKVTRNMNVLLQQRLKLNVAFPGAVDEVVVTGTKMVVDSGQASLKNSFDSDTIENIPVGQEYRDILKMLPGVQYSENSTRGPNAGGSGQDNIYQIDGVDVSLPLFGNLATEPSTADVDQVSVLRGGAKAVGFVRTGGVQVNTISKRGTNEFHGSLEYKIQTSGLTADRKIGDQVIKSETDLDWLTATLSGPVVKDMFYLYGSYYHPTVTRKNRASVYGDVPDFDSKRDQFFIKGTLTPTDNLLFDLSYKTSDRATHNSGVGGLSHPSTSSGSDANQDIIIGEANWVIDDSSSINAKFVDWQLKTASRPDTLFNFDIRQGDSLDINNLDQQGLLFVPTLLDNPNNDPAIAAINAFRQGVINQYGYVDANGVRQGGGMVGGATTINNQDFFRKSFEIGYDKSFITGEMTHNFHIGYKYEDIREDLNRLSNGYGSISVLGGNSNSPSGAPIFYQARVSQMSILGANGNTLVPDTIKSSSKLQSVEFNDTIENGPWTINLGVMLSNDTLYGQGLKENSNSPSGYELAIGHKYKMHESKWQNMIQPRFGVAYDWTDNDHVYANFARYNPPASSLARAASWGRNLRKTLRVNFDANGNFIDIDPVRSSSGKLFQEGIKPRFINEYLVGWDHVVNDALQLKMHVRHRKGGNFWEDTPNTARLSPDAPDNIPHTPYIPNLNDLRFDPNYRIGGSSYVIAQLDTGYTKYWEAGLEADYHADNFDVNASYTWSRYRGNFDQDNTTTSNDANTFVGSSFIADGAGRYLWNNRDGILRGDKPHQIKVSGYYRLPWKGRVGGLFNYASGQPWEKWSYTPYSNLTRSRSDTSRYAEPAGSRRSKAHAQLDVNYTQEIEILDGRSIELRAELFNLLNSQTGYNINPKEHSSTFGLPRSYYNPRRIRLSVKAKF